MVNNNILSTKQFGFIGGRSTTLQLLTFLGECVKTLARGDIVDIVSWTLTRPLTLYHIAVSLESWKTMVLMGLLSWISSFLMGRTQKVSVNGSLSSRKPVLSGIP